MHSDQVEFAKAAIRGVAVDKSVKPDDRIESLNKLIDLCDELIEEVDEE